MLLGGLWHGASWTFVAWGAFHGSLLAIERAWKGVHRESESPGRALTFLLVALGWVLFRAPDIGHAGAWYLALFSPAAGALPAGAAALALLIAVSAAFAHVGPNTFELEHRGSPVATAALAGLFAVSLFLLLAGRPSPFLYFQF
jgi:alginate O-acetyltransferase complex protein AlgI